MKAQRKTKQIQKAVKKAQRKGTPNSDKPQGEPQLKSLSDFVTALTPIYASKPIYTGGRIITSQGRVYASCNQEIAIYDLASKASLPRLKHVHHHKTQINQQIINFAVNMAGTKIITFTENGLLRLVDLQTEKVLQITKINSKLFPNDIAFSQDSRHVALGFSNQIIKIFTTESFKQTHSYQHSAPVRHVQWHPNNQLLQVVSSDDSRKIVVFDYVANKIVGQVQGGHTFSFGEGGKTIATIFNQEIRVYEYKSLKLKQKIVVGQYLEALTVSGQYVMFGGEQTQLLLWKMGEDRIRSIERGTEKGVMKILNWEKQKKSLIVSIEQNLTVLNTKNFQPEEMIVGYNDEIIDIKYSKTIDSDFMLLITNSSNAKIINRYNNAFHCLLEGHADIILCGQYWHPWIVTAGKDKTIKLWKLNEAAQPRLFANYRGHSDDICGIAWLPKSHLIVSVGQDKTIKIWPICQTGTDLVEINSALTTVMGHQKTINAVRVSIREQLIATCSHDRTVRIWDKTLNKIFTLTGHKRGVWDAAFHDKESLLVTAGGDGMLKGWSMVDGSCVWSMGEGSGLVRVQWIYEHQVVTGSVDGILKLWDVRKKTSLSYDKHEGRIWALQVCKNDKGKCQIATGANDSVYQIWADSTEQTRDRILRQGQAQEKQRILLEQFRFQKKYLQASKVAFDANYRQMFMQVLQQMVHGGEKDISIDENGMIAQEPQPRDKEEIKAQLKQLVTYALERDSNKLFNILLAMNSAVKHFKAANYLFLQVLRQKKLKGLLQAEHTFSLPQISQEIGEKESDFEKFLKNMLLYTEKHNQRLQRYVRGSYWMDHLMGMQTQGL